MVELPDDVMRAAADQCDRCGITLHSDMRIHAVHVAAFAIIAERKRCAAIAENYNETQSQFATIMRNWKMENHTNGGINIEIANLIRSGK